MSFIIAKQAGEDIKVDAVGNATTVDITYMVSGYSSDVLAQAAFDTYIRSYLNHNIAGRALTFTGNDLKHIECEHYEAVAHYATLEAQGDGGGGEEQQTPEWGFDISGETVHKTHGYAVRDAFPLGAPKDLFGGAINVEKDSKGRLKVNGVDDEESLLQMYCDFKIPMPGDPPAFARNLANVANHTNLNVWYGFQPGEILFRGASIKGRIGEKWNMRYTFLASPSVVVDVGGAVGVCFKRGFDYIWVYYDAVIRDFGGGKLIVPTPVYAFTHQMKLEADLRILGIGG